MQHAVPRRLQRLERPRATGLVRQVRSIASEIAVPFLIWAFAELALEQEVGDHAQAEEDAEGGAEALLLARAPVDVVVLREALPDVRPRGDAGEDRDGRDGAECAGGGGCEARGGALGAFEGEEGQDGEEGDEDGGEDDAGEEVGVDDDGDAESEEGAEEGVRL